MTNYQALIHNFNDLRLKRGGIDFFEHQHIEPIINYCLHNHIKILGFDGFYLTPTTTQPSMEHSIDFSKLSGLCIQESLDYISKMPSNMFFEIVVDE